MRIVFLLIGNVSRSGELTGEKIRYGGTSCSGTESSVIYVAEYLSKNGYDVTIACERMSTPQTSNGLKIFQQAVLNVTPVVEVKSRRVGGSNYQVPLEVNSERGTSLALRWIVQAARQRPGREMATKLANELLDASNKTGAAIRKREETHRMAEANKAFAHYKW